jgi:hypothetical protein
MFDFTLSSYSSFLETLSKQGFSFQSFTEFLESPEQKVIILRHDVDLLPANSLLFAKLEAEKGIKGTYYFRIVPESFDEKIIKEIYELGHEVGYHYEDVSMAAQWYKGIKAQRQKTGKGNRTNDTRPTEEDLVKIAIESFKENLEKLRKIVPVQTICMHGSPMSRWDSRLLWKYYDYHDFGIVGEPYFDINFDEVLYLTDTGRRWDGDSFNIRDKAVGRRQKAKGTRLKSPLQPSALSPQPEISPSPFHPLTSSGSLKFHTTFDLITAAENGLFPDKIMLTLHPQRWTDKPVPWMKELIWQNTKNVAKYFLIKLRS